MFLSKFASRIWVVAGVGCTFHCVFEYICDFVVCSGKIFNRNFIFLISLNKSPILGESMQPTLETNNILICSKLTQRFNEFNRNDIIIAIHPNQPKNLICKRLIALPGDIVLMNSIDDNFTKAGDEDSEMISGAKKIFIKPGSCWVEGDNRLNSTDSRNYGQIPMGLIKSKVLARVWPPREFKIF